MFTQFENQLIDMEDHKRKEKNEKIDDNISEEIIWIKKYTGDLSLRRSRLTTFCSCLAS